MKKSSRRTVQFIVTIQEDWQWLSAKNNVKIPISQNGPTLKGQIELPANGNYWYSAAKVYTNKHQATGEAMLRIFSKDGLAYVEACTIAYGHWENHGDKSTTESTTNTNGGINLTAKFV